MEFVLLLTLLNVLYIAPSSGYSHSFDDATGPQYWPSEYDDFCGGKRQSPIAIVHDSTALDKDLGDITFTNYDSEIGTTTLVNNGHSAQLSFDSPTLTISDGGLPSDYQLIQLHFHWGSVNTRGSEHTLNGEEFPLEMHLVHIKAEHVGDVAAALADSEGLAVVGVFFELGAENEALAPIVSELSNVETSGDTVDFELGKMLEELLPNDRKFYRYEGSLTTPTCDEAVIWSVLKKTLTVSAAQLEEFRTLQDGDSNSIQDNFRFPQPVHDREVKRNADDFKAGNLCVIPFICDIAKNMVDRWVCK